MKRNNNPRNPSRGFTLTELLVVITVIGILASIVLVSISGAQSRARDSRIKTSMSQVRSFALLEAQEADGYYTDVCPKIMASEIFSDVINMGGTVDPDPCKHSPDSFCLEVTLNNNEKWCVDPEKVSLGTCDGSYCAAGEAAENGIGDFCTTEEDVGETKTTSDVVFCAAINVLYTQTAPGGNNYPWSSGSHNVADCNSHGTGNDFEACDYCNTLTYAGKTGWTLPDRPQLRNEFGVPACGWDECTEGDQWNGCGGQSSCDLSEDWDTPDAADNLYWSSTESYTDFAWWVHFRDGNVDNFGTKSGSRRVRCRLEL